VPLPLHRRLSVITLTAVAALLAGFLIPSSPLDRTAFRLVVGSFANPPFIPTGQGTHSAPWTYRTVGLPSGDLAKHSPSLISITDDPEGVFQTSPPSPIDIAVTLQNIQRLGATDLSIAAVLAWENPDNIGLAAMDRQLANFKSLTTAAPVTRGISDKPVPASFRRASLAPNAIHGDVTRIPAVNQIPITTILLGGENALSGFTNIESETDPSAIPMLARWDDRIILSFPTVATLTRLNLKPDDLEIRLGEFMKFGNIGPVIPIDPFGRFVPPKDSLESAKRISASELIDGDSQLFPNGKLSHPVLLDEQSAAPAATRSFSSSLPATLAGIIAESGLTPPKPLNRLSVAIETIFLLSIALACGFLLNPSRFANRIIFASIAAIIITAQWIGAGPASTWLPGLPALAGILTAALFIEIAPPATPRPKSKNSEKPKPPVPTPTSPPPQSAPSAKITKPTGKPPQPAKKATTKIAKKQGKKSSKKSGPRK
jgi:hypothetical protein